MQHWCQFSWHHYCTITRCYPTVRLGIGPGKLVHLLVHIYDPRGSFLYFYNITVTNRSVSFFRLHQFRVWRRTFVWCSTIGSVSQRDFGEMRELDFLQRRLNHDWPAAPSFPFFIKNWLISVIIANYFLFLCRLVNLDTLLIEGRPSNKNGDFRVSIETAGTFRLRL